MQKDPLFLIYPNPSDTDNLLHIKKIKSDNLEFIVSIINLSGKQIGQFQIINNLELSSLSPGLYFLNIVGKYSNEVHKLVVN